ncbi:MAG: adenosylmethionine--8-amino-7-oxononanoate transaminase [Rhizonema sp. NSF051]|nr:adenosylmethionine--8-amino-7-oxononanoate transaminase [Rhizonema sp. NSF051]
MTLSFPVEKDCRHIWTPFTQAQTASPPLLITEGKGAILKDANGREYLDLISSWWVNLHGHAHPAIVQAIAEQASKLEQVIFAGCTHEPAINLANSLASLLPGDLGRVFFSDDGSTAVEVALKIALQYHRNMGDTRRTRLLAFEGGYHGDTFGAMATGGRSGFFDAFAPKLFPVDFLPFPATWQGDSAVEEKEQASLAQLDLFLTDHGQETAAIILEPLVQGASGMRMNRPSFIRQVCERVKAAGVLVIFDEVMTGFGRTGTMFALEQVGWTPDMICLAKGLTGGFLPLAVTVCQEYLYEAFLDDGFDKALAHGHSFTANPLGCAAALASLRLFREEDTFRKIETIHQTHQAGLIALENLNLPHLDRFRLCGTIAAFDIDVADAGYRAGIGKIIREKALEHNLLLRPLGNTVYLLPPYCLTAEVLRDTWNRISRIIEELDV